MEKKKRSARRPHHCFPSEQKEGGKEKRGLVDLLRKGGKTQKDPQRSPDYIPLKGGEEALKGKRGRKGKRGVLKVFSQGE